MVVGGGASRPLINPHICFVLCSVGTPASHFVLELSPALSVLYSVMGILFTVTLVVLTVLVIAAIVTTPATGPSTVWF